MSFTPLRSKSRTLSVWFASRPDLFISERSPRKTAFWASAAGVLLLLTFLVVVTPMATVDLFGGRARSGLAIVAAFALPPVLSIVCSVMVFVGARRWRVRDGGALLNPTIHGFGMKFPIDPLLVAIRAGAAESAQITAGLTAVQADGGEARLITIWSSKADRLMYGGLLCVDGDAVWIDREPFAVSAERYFDAKELDRAARAMPRKDKEISMTGPHTHWNDLASRLALTLRSLSNREVLIIQKAGDKRRYVQFLVTRDALSGEAPSVDVVPDADEAVRRVARWASPTGDQPNWTSQVTLPASTAGCEELAARCVAALRDAHGILFPSDLHYRAWREPDGRVGGDPGDPGLVLDTLGLDRG